MIQHLERSKHEALPPGPNASQNTRAAITRQESGSKGLSAGQSWVMRNPSIAEAGRDPWRPRVTSLPGAKSQQETQDLIKWSCHCPRGRGSPSTQADPAGLSGWEHAEGSQDAGHPLHYSCM